LEKKQIRINNVRLAFPNLFEPKAGDDGKLKFGCAFILPKDHADLAALRAAIEKAGVEKWGQKWPTVKKALAADNKLLLKDGDSKAEYAGYEGNMFFNANNPARPKIVDQQKNPLDQSDGKPYAGCYVTALVDVWAMDNKFGKRICATVTAVQFVRDGEAFSGAAAADLDDLDEITEGAEAEDLV